PAPRSSRSARRAPKLGRSCCRTEGNRVLKCSPCAGQPQGERVHQPLCILLFDRAGWQADHCPVTSNPTGKLVLLRLPGGRLPCGPLLRHLACALLGRASLARGGRPGPGRRLLGGLPRSLAGCLLGSLLRCLLRWCLLGCFLGCLLCHLAGGFLRRRLLGGSLPLCGCLLCS